MEEKLNIKKIKLEDSIEEYIESTKKLNRIEKGEYLTILFLFLLKKLIEINSILYKKTELHEQRFITDFMEERFNYFKANTGWLTKKYNKLLDIQKKQDLPWNKEL